MFFENSPKDDCNSQNISQLNHLEVTVETFDVLFDSTPRHLQTSLSSRSSSTTTRLPSFLTLKKGARVTIELNVDLNDCSIDGEFGVVFHFGYIDCSITKVYVNLDDKDAGKETMSKELHTTKYKVVPLQIIDANIIISKISSQILKTTHFPLTLACACTVHKVQDLTLLNSTVVSLELIKQK